MQLGKAEDDAPSVWAPVTHVEDLDKAAGFFSLAQSYLTIATILVLNHGMG